MTTRETIKQALISILVGAVIAFLTTLMQGLIGWLHNVYVEPAGTVGGIVYYAAKVLRRG